MNTVAVPRPAAPGCKRGTFHTRYLLDKSKLDHRYDGWRLLDCLLWVATEDAIGYLELPKNGEFAVIDVRTREKAFFEMPFGCIPDRVTAMVNSHFAAVGFRIADKLWAV